MQKLKFAILKFEIDPVISLLTESMYKVKIQIGIRLTLIIINSVKIHYFQNMQLDAHLQKFSYLY